MSLTLPTACSTAAAALSLAGLALATYLSVSYLSGDGASCGTGGCSLVTTSEYALFAGVPVAMLGVGGYAVLLLGSLAALGIPNPPASLRWTLAAIAAIGFVFSAYLTATQVFFIQSYCIFCLSSAALITTILALNLTAAIRR